MIKSTKSGPGPTGPRTPRGKAKSRHNALKHGIFSKVVVLKDETQAEYNALWNGLRDYFRPTGAYEEGLVEILASTWWRQRRLLIAEGAEIQAGKEFLEWDEEQRQLVEAGNILDVNRNVGLMRQISNTEALQVCLNLLANPKINIEKHGLNDEDLGLFLNRLYGRPDLEHRCEPSLYRSFLHCSHAAAEPEDVRQQKGSLPVEENKQYFLDELEQEQKSLKHYHEQKVSIDADRIKLESLCRNVPDSPRLDRLLRYAASLERTFDRTVYLLERAQRMRRGQRVQPPIGVNVSSA